MSALTKVFIVLLVVVCLMFVAGTVVFINRQENYAVEVKNLQGQIKAREAEVTTWKAAAAAAENRTSQDRALHDVQVAELRKSILEREAEVGKLGTQVAEKESALKKVESDIARLTEGLKASEQQKTLLQGQIADARKAADDYVKRVSDLNATVAELTNLRDALDREMRFYKEQFSQAQGQVASLNDVIKKHNIRVGESGGALRSPITETPNIRAVIRETKLIEGIRYGTISVGSADDVRKGMRFTIIDRDRSEFLGFLTVDSVGANEATGRLEGPKVDQVRAGNDAVTQL